MSNFTQEQLSELEKAIASGCLEVKYSDKSIRYRSIDEMLKARDIMRRELGLSGKTTRVLAKHSKGFTK